MLNESIFSHTDFTRVRSKVSHRAKISLLHWSQTLSVVLCCVVLCCVLFYSILFYSIPFYSILFYSILFYSILFYSIKLCQRVQLNVCNHTVCLVLVNNILVCGNWLNSDPAVCVWECLFPFFILCVWAKKTTKCEQITWWNLVQSCLSLTKCTTVKVSCDTNTNARTPTLKIRKWINKLLNSQRCLQ